MAAGSQSVDEVFGALFNREYIYDSQNVNSIFSNSINNSDSQVSEFDFPATCQSAALIISERNSNLIRSIFQTVNRLVDLFDN